MGVENLGRSGPATRCDQEVEVRRPGADVGQAVVIGRGATDRSAPRFQPMPSAGASALPAALADEWLELCLQLLVRLPQTEPSCLTANRMASVRVAQAELGDDQRRCNSTVRVLRNNLLAT